ncbi:unnamed protein product [Rhodiola kirilowii]
MQRHFLAKYYPAAKAGQVLLDASAGGTIMNLSLAGVRNLIAEVAENARFREEASRHEEFSRARNVVKG